MRETLRWRDRKRCGKSWSINQPLVLAVSVRALPGKDAGGGNPAGLPAPPFGWHFDFGSLMTNWYEQVQAIIDYAEDHPISLAELEVVHEGRSNFSPSEFPGHVLETKRGLRVVYTIEEQPIGWCRHLSISFRLTGEVPDEDRNSILSDFGFDTDIAVLSYPEGGQISDGRAIAAPNFIQKIPAHDDYWLRLQGRSRNTNQLYS